MFRVRESFGFKKLEGRVDHTYIIRGCVRLDAAVGIDSVLIAQKRTVPVIVPDSYFDSLARIDAPLGKFTDSCSVDTFSQNGSIEMVYLIYFHSNINTGEIRDIGPLPKSELLFAYKKGYKIWRFDQTRDTLTTVPEAWGLKIKEFRLSAIRLQKK